MTTLPATQAQKNTLPDLVRPQPNLAALTDFPESATHWNRIGLYVLFGGLGGFLLWSSLFELAGGAYAHGMVRLSDEKQVVAHVEGGIIRRLAVTEGTKVTAGQELVVLDDYNSETSLAISEKKRWELLARKARLEAARDGLEEIIFPAEVTAQKDNPEVAEIIAAQNRQFQALRADLDGQKQILLQQSAQYQAIIDSLKTQVETSKTQLGLIAEEAAGVQELLSKGLERRPRLLALKRQQAALEGQQADYNGRIASYQEKLGENELQISNLLADARAKVTTELTEVQADLTQTEEQWSNARMRSRELTLRAAQDGTVLNLRYRSVGAVVAPGQSMMEIVPDTKMYVVDVRVMPTDIDVLQKLPIGPVPEDRNPPAQIRLSGLKQRTHMTLRANILRIAPDAMHDPQSGATFFEARVSFDPHDPEFAKLMRNNDLFAGMPAEVTFISQRRTLLQYLWQPVADSFYRSFHEE